LVEVVVDVGSIGGLGAGGWIITVSIGGTGNLHWNHDWFCGFPLWLLTRTNYNSDDDCTGDEASDNDHCSGNCRYVGCTVVATADTLS